MQRLQALIDNAWEQRASISPASADADVKNAVDETIDLLDQGRLRVAEKTGGEWVTHQWVKKAVLLSFRLHNNHVIQGGYTQIGRAHV